MDCRARLPYTAASVVEAMTAAKRQESGAWIDLLFFAVIFGGIFVLLVIGLIRELV